MTTLPQTSWADYSHWNFPRDISSAVVLKATEGVSYKDPAYQRFVNLAATGHHNAFAYHVLHTGGAQHVREQCSFAWSVIGKRPMMFDVEMWPRESGSPGGIASLSEVLTAIDYYRRLGGITNVIYLPRSQWRNMHSPDLTPLIQRGMHIINADYRTGAGRPGSFAWVPYGGIKPWAIQWAACRNVAMGTWAQAKAIWTGTTPPPTPPAPVPETLYYTVKNGDTMWDIARHHQMTLDQLEKMNPHAGHPTGNFDNIWAGDKLRVR